MPRFSNVIPRLRTLKIENGKKTRKKNFRPFLKTTFRVTDSFSFQFFAGWEVHWGIVFLCYDKAKRVDRDVHMLFTNA